VDNVSRPDLGKIGMVKINVFYTRMNGKWNEIKKKEVERKKKIQNRRMLAA